MQASESVDSRLVIPPRVHGGGSRRRWVVLSSALLGIALAVVLVLMLRSRGQAPPYRTAAIERRSIIQVVEATGHLDVGVRAEVPAPAPGQLVEIVARAGDPVKRGQMLARLDARATLIGERTAQAKAAAASSHVAEAEAALSAASDARARTERLRARELASESELTSVRAEEQKAKAALHAARAEQSSAAQGFKLAALTQDLTRIDAPMDGVILKAPETNGAAVTPEQGALFIVGSSPRTLRIEADVAESDIGEVHPGQMADFSVPAFPGRTFEARVTRTGLDAVRSGLAVRYPVELSADNADLLLLPGMTSSVRIQIARADGVLATREAALRFQPAGADVGPSRVRVWRLSGTELDPVAVKPGISDGAYTAIEPNPPSALPLGSRVVVGLVNTAPSQAGGPGIKLGKR